MVPEGWGSGFLKILGYLAGEWRRTMGGDFRPGDETFEELSRAFVGEA